MIISEVEGREDNVCVVRSCEQAFLATHVLQRTRCDTQLPNLRREETGEKDIFGIKEGTGGTS